MTYRHELPPHHFFAKLDALRRRGDVPPWRLRVALEWLQDDLDRLVTAYVRFGTRDLEPLCEEIGDELIILAGVLGAHHAGLLGPYEEHVVDWVRLRLDEMEVTWHWITSEARASQKPD